MLAAAVTLGGAAPSRSAMNPEPLRCDEMDVLREAGRDDAIVCVDLRNGGMPLHLSTNGGRSFRTVKPVGLPPSGDRVWSVLLSPGFATDNTIYLRYQQLGVFMSSDRGATFLLIDPQGGAPSAHRMSRLVGVGPLGALGDVVGLGNQGGPAVVWRGQHLPVSGSGDQDDYEFVQIGRGPGAPVLVTSRNPTVPPGSAYTRVHMCTAALSCTEVTATLERNSEYVELVTEPVDQSRVVAVVTKDRLAGLGSLWVSRDKGVTFSRNAGLRSIAAGLSRSRLSDVWISSIALEAAGRWLVALEGNQAAWTYSTQDYGRTWKRLPSIPPYQPFGQRVLAGSGRLYADDVFRCSVDHGRRWALRCTDTTPGGK